MDLHFATAWEAVAMTRFGGALLPFNDSDDDRDLGSSSADVAHLERDGVLWRRADPPGQEGRVMTDPLAHPGPDR